MLCETKKGMDDPRKALEQLETIRSLLERATAYRVICAPSAIMGGTAALMLGLVQAWLYQGQGSSPFQPVDFVCSWLVVLALAGGSNILMLLRDSKRRGEVAPSPRMRMALNAVLPPFVVTGVLGLAIFHLTGDPFGCVTTWVIGYGASLHAASGFAPRTLQRAGRICLISGILLACAWGLSGVGEIPYSFSGLAMAVVFGAVHLEYGVRALLWNSASKLTESNPTVK